MESDQAKIARYEKALREITRSRGPYKMDELEHADSTISAMKEVAEMALRGEYSEDWDS